MCLRVQSCIHCIKLCLYCRNNALACLGPACAVVEAVLNRIVQQLLSLCGYACIEVDDRVFFGKILNCFKAVIHLF